MDKIFWPVLGTVDVHPMPKQSAIFDAHARVPSGTDRIALGHETLQLVWKPRMVRM